MEKFFKGILNFFQNFSGGCPQFIALFPEIRDQITVYNDENLRSEMTPPPLLPFLKVFRKFIQILEVNRLIIIICFGVTSSSLHHFLHCHCHCNHNSTCHPKSTKITTKFTFVFTKLCRFCVKCAKVAVKFC